MANVAPRNLSEEGRKLTSRPPPMTLIRPGSSDTASWNTLCYVDCDDGLPSQDSSFSALAP